MTDPSRQPDSGDDAAVRPASDADAGLPRWVKISGIVALLVALLFAIMMLTGVGGEHGPSRHSGSAATLGASSSSNATGQGISL